MAATIAARNREATGYRIDVITYFTVDRMSGCPTIVENRSVDPPRRSPFKSRQFASLPLVSHPTAHGHSATGDGRKTCRHLRLAGVQRIDACSGRQHQLIVTCHRLRWSASWKSVSRAKCR